MATRDKLSPVQQAVANQMFEAYDTDASGSLDMQEFCVLIQKYDSSLNLTAVEATFKMATDGAPVMSRTQFYAWLLMLFGEASEQEFVSGVHELIKAKVKSVPDVPIRASTHIECEKVIDASSGECQQLLKKLFNLYDTDHSGFLELPEFVSICRVHDPEMAPELAYRAYAAVAQPAGLDTRGLLGWLIDSYGIEERGFMQSVQRLIDASGPSVSSILPPARKAWADKLFSAYDADGNHFIDMKEFSKLVKKHDPRMTTDDIRRSFELVHVVHDRIDVVAFYSWLALMFGDCNLREFENQMHNLICLASPPATARHSQSQSKQSSCVSTQLGARSQRWGKALFKIYADSTGDMSVEAFTCLLRQYDPEISSENAHAVFESCGATGNSVNINVFFAWLELLFGLDESQLEQGVRMLIEQSAEKLNAQMPLQWRAWAETIFRSFDTTCTGELSAGHLSTLMSTILTVDKASDKQTLHALLETSGCSSTINLLCFERWLMLQFHELDDLQFAKFVHAMLTASPRGCELDFDELIGSIK